MSEKSLTIGLDFDNTLVCYDQLFYDLAQEKLTLPASVAVTKTAVRNYFRTQNRESEWTALQGLAYGLRIVEARPFDGLLACLKFWEQQGCRLLIVSHKTRKPYAGPAYDLHAAARDWIETHLFSAGLKLLGGVFLEETRDLKLARIRDLNPAVYIDDLPDIISDLDTQMELHKPSKNTVLNVHGLLFDPHDLYRGDLPTSRVYQNWSQLQKIC